MTDVEVVLDVETNARKRVWKWSNPYGELAPLGFMYHYRADGLLEEMTGYNVMAALAGSSTKFHTHGLLKASYHYTRHGQKNGFWVSYNYDGSQHMYGSYKKGRRDGAWCVWKTSVDCNRRDDIDVTHISHYRDGLLDGSHAIYTLDGQLQKACSFYRGRQMVYEWGREWYRRTELGSVLYYDHGPSEEDFERVQTYDKYIDIRFNIFGRNHPIFGDLAYAFDFRNQ